MGKPVIEAYRGMIRVRINKDLTTLEAVRLNAQFSKAVGYSTWINRPLPRCPLLSLIEWPVKTALSLLSPSDDESRPE